jgi:Protein of unknown function (DUF1572)
MAGRPNLRRASILAHVGEVQQGRYANLRFDRRRIQNEPMALQFTASFLEDSVSLLRHYKRLAEQAIAQVPDGVLNTTLDAESNSIAIIVKHLAGNMRSRWQNFLDSDGEKPGRDRDSEFRDAPQTRAEIMATWEEAWKIVFDELAPLNDADLARTVLIRGERHSVLQAINRQVAHYAYHIGQIVFVAKHLTSGHWTTLTIPRGKSVEYNARVASGKISQR